MSQDNVTDREPAAAREDGALLPPVDVIEDADGITLYADLPGVPRDKVNVRVEADTLTIEGEIAIAAVQGLEPSHAEGKIGRAHV